MKIAAVILAGGKASRLSGIAKGNIYLGKKETIISHIVAELYSSQVKQISISTNETTAYSHYQLPIIRDLQQNCGPLAGIEAGLKFFQDDYDAVLFTPADLPYISRNEFLALKKQLVNNNICFAHAPDGNHALCAIIRTNQLAKISAAIQQRQYKITKLWRELKAAAIEFPDAKPFFNINTDENLKAIKWPVIWIVCGAGRGVGKTTVATKLAAILPNSIYAKFGHGQFKPHKPQNFFHTLAEINNFIAKNSPIKKHIIIESNSLVLAKKGDIRIYLSGITNKTNIRTDNEKLKQLSNIKIDHRKNYSEWQAIINTYILDINLSAEIIKILNQQKIFCT